MKITHPAAISTVLTLFIAVSACGGPATAVHSGATSGYVLDVDAAPLLDPTVYSPPKLIVGDLADSGFWYWTVTSDASYLEHFSNQSHTTTSFLVSSVPLSRVSTSKGALAVAPDGDIWLGVGLSLYELTPSSGQVEVYTIPSSDVVDNSAAESYRPSELQGAHGIQALAISPDGGQVSVGIEAAQTVLTLSALNGAFSTVSLPSATDAISLLYTANSEMAIGLENYATHGVNTVLFQSGGTESTVSVPDSAALSMNDGVLISGYGIPGSVSNYTTPSNASSTSLMGSNVPFPVAVASASLGDGNTLLVGMHVLEIESNSQRSVEQQVQIPMSSSVCNYSMPATAQTSSAEPCSSEPTAVASDGLGDARLVGITPGFISELQT